MALALRHISASFIVFAVLVTLFLNAYNGFESYYKYERDSESLDENNKNIAERIMDLALIEGVSGITNAIRDITTPSNPLDVLGALAAAAWGALVTIGGIIVFPVQILSIITQFYPTAIPSVVTGGMGAIIGLYIAYVIFSSQANKET